MLELEDIKWKQRAKWNRFRNGDQNTQFFHVWATHRRKNFIRSIIDEEGTHWTKTEDIEKVFISYYQALYITNLPTKIAASLREVGAQVTEDMNFNLLKEFVGAEVDLALFQMYPLKSLGPDGFSACFYQRHWMTVGREVKMVVLHFLNSGIFDPDINTNFIALISKVSP